MRVLVFLGVFGAGCVGARIPPLSPQADPPVQSDRVVALADAGLRAVVVRDSDQGLALLQLDFDAEQSRVLVALGDDDRASFREAVSRDALVRAVYDSGARGALDALGYAPAELLEADALELTTGILRFDGNAVVLDDGERSVTIRSLGGQRRPDAVRWLVSLRRTRIAAELHYTNAPVESRTLWLFALPRLEAEQISAKALELFERGELREAAKAWRRALARHPAHGDSHYNLACTEARLGDAREALRQLRDAIAVAPYRYRALAKVDADLDGIRGHREFQRLVFGDAR